MRHRSNSSRQGFSTPTSVVPSVPQRTIYREARHARRRGLYMGTDMAHKHGMYLLLKWLHTGIHVLGPTGGGKSRLLLWLFQLLCSLERPIVLIDPKGGLYAMARDFALANGYARRLVLFDLAGDKLLGYNPLRENRLSISMQSKWVRESVKSAWGQTSFDQTPQLQRFLYLILYVARACHIPLDKALDLLRPYTTIREEVLPRLADPFVHDALLAFDQLPPRRQEELGASTVARLESFVCDDLIRPIITSPVSLDLEDALAQGKIILVNFAKHQPLLPDDLKLLGRMFVNDLLAHVYKGHGEGRFNEEQPIYLMIDEVQNFATRQLCDATDEGRGIGLCNIYAHQFCWQLANEDQSGYLLHSVMNDLRTKIIFGGLEPDELERFSKMVFLDRYNPWIIKDELRAPLFRPVESTRMVRSTSRSTGKTFGLSLPKTESIGVNDSTSRGKTASTGKNHTITKNRSTTHSTTHGRSENHGVGQTNGAMWSETEGEGEQWGTSDSKLYSSGLGGATTTMASTGTGVMYPQEVEGDRLGDIVRASEHEGTGRADSYNYMDGYASGTVDSRGGSKSKARTNGGSHAFNTTDTYGTQHSEGLSQQAGESEGHGVTHEKGTTDTKTHGLTRTASHGKVPSWSVSESGSETVTETPFTEYVEDEIVTSRTFLSLDEQTLLFMQQLHALPKACFCLKTPTSTASFLQAPWVPDPHISQRERNAGLARAYEYPGYFERSAPQGELTPPLTPDVLPRDEEPKLVFSQPRRERKRKPKK